MRRLSYWERCCFAAPRKRRGRHLQMEFLRKLTDADEPYVEGGVTVTSLDGNFGHSPIRASCI